LTSNTETSGGGGGAGFASLPQPHKPSTTAAAPTVQIAAADGRKRRIDM
jgi:hypothetical protein